MIMIDRSAFGPLLVALRACDVDGRVLPADLLSVVWKSPASGRFETTVIEGYAPGVVRLTFGRSLDAGRPGFISGETSAQLTCAADEMPAVCAWAVRRLCRGEPLPPYAWTSEAWLLNPRKGRALGLPPSWRLETERS
jgi:hypothetical protein